MKWLDDPKLERKIHGSMTLIWLVLFLPAVLFWKKSVPFLVFVSVYANFVGHYASWQAAKAEDNILKEKQ